MVFVGRNDGRLTALNTTTGKRLWEFQTGAGVNAPAAVFEYEGEEYVAVYSAGSVFAGTPHGDSVWLFSLKGTMEQAAPALTNAPAGTPDRKEPDLARGESIFREACSSCHGRSGEGGHGRPGFEHRKEPGQHHSNGPAGRDANAFLEFQPYGKISRT